MIPRLFAWPPVASPAQALERLSIALLVASAVFEFVTGVMNMQYWYAFRFNFVVAHYYGAIVFVASLVLHVAIKMPVILRAYRERGVLKPLRDDLARTRPEPPTSTAASSPPRPPRRRSRRRGLFALVGAGSLALLLANVGETIGGPLRRLSLLAPRRQVIGPGPNDFQVNKTAPRRRHHAGDDRPGRTGSRCATRAASCSLSPRRAAGDGPAHRAAADRVRGGLDDHAGVDGRAARRAGARRPAPPGPASALVRSLQPRGVLSRASLNARPARAIPTRCWR